MEGDQMFGWFKKKPDLKPTGEKVAHQPPGEVFPWATGWRLTALDEAIIAVPAAILNDSEAIGSVIHCDNGVQLNLPTGPHSTSSERIMIWLQPGQSVWLAKSCTAVVLAKREGDTAVRRFRLTEVTQHAESDRVSSGGDS